MMDLMITIIFNLIFCSVMYLIFQNKYNKAMGNQLIKKELEELVILFNRQAERNISALEAKIKNADELLKKHDQLDQNQNAKRKPRPPKLVVDKTSLKKPQKKTIVLENKFPDHNRIKDILSIDPGKIKKITPPSSDPIKHPSLPEKIKKNFNLSLGERLKHLHQSGMNNKDLAIQFNISVDEVKFRLNLN